MTGCHSTNELPCGVFAVLLSRRQPGRPQSVPVMVLGALGPRGGVTFPDTRPDDTEA
jgi:hypothetical protein